MPAYTFRAVGAVSHNSNSAALTPGAPAGKTVGDLLILFTANYATSQTIATPTGWTLLFFSAAPQAGVAIYARIADGTATDTPSPDWSGSADSLAWIVAYTGDVYTGDLRGIVAALDIGTGSSASPNAQALDSPGINDCLLFLATVKRKTSTSDDATTLTVPASGSWTKRGDLVQSGTALVAGIADWQQTTSTAFDGTDWTVNGTAESLGTVGVTIALKSNDGAPSTIFVDVATEHVRTGTTSPQTFSHAAASSGVTGVLLAIVHGTSSTDHVSAASYGGVAMARIQRNVDTLTEPGASEWWWLGTGILQGTQTVSYTPGTTTDDIHAVCITLTSALALEIEDNDGVDNNVANPSVTLQAGGNEILCFGALYGGAASPADFVPNDFHYTVHDHDLGAFYSEVFAQYSSRFVDTPVGGTAGTDDVALAAVAVTKIIPPGGTTYTKSHSDALGMSEVQPRSAFRGRVFSEAQLVTELQPRGIRRGRVVADTLALADVQIKVTIRGRAAADAVGVTDQQSRGALRGRVQSDPLGLTDSVARTMRRSAARTDTLAVTDTTPATIGRGRVLGESLTISELAVGNLTKSRGATDSLGVTDAQGKVVGRGRASADGVGVTDQQSRRLLAGRSRADSLTVTDSQPRGIRRGRVQSDTAQVADSQSSIRIRGRANVDMVAVADAALRLSVIRGRVQSDGSTVADELRRSILRGRVIVDAVALFDEIIHEVFEYQPPDGTVITRTLLEEVGIVEQISATLRRGRVQSDAAAVTESMLRGLYRSRLFGESLTVQDFALASLVRVASVAESVRIEDGYLRFMLRSRAVLDLLEVDDQISKTYLPGQLYEVRIRLGVERTRVSIGQQYAVSLAQDTALVLGHDLPITLASDKLAIKLGGV